LYADYAADTEQIVNQSVARRMNDDRRIAEELKKAVFSRVCARER
jgi:hypothetical protein